MAGQIPNPKHQIPDNGLGLGGKHTRPEGRAVNFVFSRLSLAELAPAVNRTFHVRLSAAAGGEPVKVSGNAPGLEEGLTLAPGQSQVISIPVKASR